MKTKMISPTQFLTSLVVEGLLSRDAAVCLAWVEDGLYAHGSIRVVRYSARGNPGFDVFLDGRQVIEGNLRDVYETRWNCLGEAYDVHAGRAWFAKVIDPEEGATRKAIREANSRKFADRLRRDQATIADRLEAGMWVLYTPGQRGGVLSAPEEDGCWPPTEGCVPALPALRRAGIYIPDLEWNDESAFLVCRRGLWYADSRYTPRRVVEHNPRTGAPVVDPMTVRR